MSWYKNMCIICVTVNRLQAYDMWKYWKWCDMKYKCSESSDASNLYMHTLKESVTSHMKHNAWDLKRKGNWPLPECQWSVYENDWTVDHVVTGHLWDSHYHCGLAVSPPTGSAQLMIQFWSHFGFYIYIGHYQMKEKRASAFNPWMHDNCMKCL